MAKPEYKGNGMEVTRRTALGGMLGVSGAAMLGSLPFGTSAASAADSPVVKVYGITSAQMNDWAHIKEAIGITIEWTPTNDDTGVFIRDVVSNNVGDTHDILIFNGGTQTVLAPQGLLAEIDTANPNLTKWANASKDWTESALVMADGKTFGVPIDGNADSFGYFPEAIGVDPSGSEEVSWGVMFEDERLRGRVGVDRNWSQSLCCAALFLNHAGRQNIADVANPTGAEAKAVVDYLIERKKAGQFRTIFSSFEEQIQLLSNKQVDALNCWEPAVRESNKALNANSVVYAYTVEGYFKWGHAAHVPAQAVDRGNIENIYKVLNYFIDGEYRAYQAIDRGYAGPNMDLGVEYAKAKGWEAEKVQSIQNTADKVARKFTKPFVNLPAPPNADAIEEEWQRFLNA